MKKVNASAGSLYSSFRTLVGSGRHLQPPAISREEACRQDDLTRRQSLTEAGVKGQVLAVITVNLRTRSPLPNR